MRLLRAPSSQRAALCHLLGVSQSSTTRNRSIKFDFATATPSCARMASSLTDTHLTPEFYDKLHRFWFDGVSPDPVLPEWKRIQKWFMKDEANDEVCRTSYGPALEAIKTAKPTADDLLDPKENPTHAIALIVLLDQMSRNIYRGPESKVVFTTYDPLALDISLRAVFPRTYQAAASYRDAERAAAAHGSNSEPTEGRGEAWYDAEDVVLHEDDVKLGGVDEGPSMRQHLAHRMWFYSPFMHSESPKIHRWAQPRYEALRKEVDAISSQASSIDQPSSPSQKTFQDERKEQDSQATQSTETNAASPPSSSNAADSDVQANKALGKNLEGFEKQHREIIERFGRYPHRNEALGRSSTPEEIEYLEKGGQTFAS